MAKNRLAMASGGLLLSGGIVLAMLTASPAIDGVHVAGNEERTRGLAIGGLTTGIAMGATGIALLSHYGMRQSWRRAEYWDSLPPEQAWRVRDTYLRRATLTGVGLFGAGLAVVGIVFALSANGPVDGHGWGTLGGLGAATAVSSAGLAVVIPSGIAWGQHRRRRGRVSAYRSWQTGYSRSISISIGI